MMNLVNMLEGKILLENKSKYKKIFFFRICGTGMGACACLLREAGLDVSGADASYSPPMSTYLESTGIPCHDLSDIDTKFLQEYDLIVVGNSVPRNSEHARLIEESGVPFTSFPAILGAFILQDRQVIGIAGTHGKTTTTYFLTQILERLGEFPGYFVGGIIEGRPPAKLGDSDFFIIESDEYDSAYFHKFAKFQLYQLNHMILTSLEFDHADIYENLEQIEKQFEEVIPKISGQIIGNVSYPSIIKMYDHTDSSHKMHWTLYGENDEKSPIGPIGIQVSENGSSFVLNWKNEDFTFTTNVIGKHNVLNISACIILLLKQGFKPEELQNAVASLSMVKRRQEVRGTYHGAIVIDDFAHHPRAVDLTIDAIQKKYPKKEVIAVFEPISATARSDFFQKDFAMALQRASNVIIAKNPLTTTVRGRSNLDCHQLVSDISKSGIGAHCVDSLVQLREKIDELADSNKVLLVLSNRTCIGLWESDFVEALV